MQKNSINCIMLMMAVYEKKLRRAFGVYRQLKKTKDLIHNVLLKAHFLCSQLFNICISIDQLNLIKSTNKKNKNFFIEFLYIVFLHSSCFLSIVIIVICIVFITVNRIPVYQPFLHKVSGFDFYHFIF